MVNRGLKVSKHSDLSWYESSQEGFADTESCGAVGLRGWEVPLMMSPHSRNSSQSDFCAHMQLVHRVCFLTVPVSACTGYVIVPCLIKRGQNEIYFPEL